MTPDETSADDDSGALDTSVVQALFWDALAEQPGTRQAWLDGQDLDPVLVAEVRELLQHHSTMDTGLLGTTPIARPASAHGDTQTAPGAHMPANIGPFRLVREIASGGMGTVYEAQQERPRRTVALKVMSWGVGSEASRRRFEFEAEALARLRHRGIAQLYAAVLPEDERGQVPYIVMEYVPHARPITRYVVAQSLSRRERLTLFAEVCDAVHHGHQRGVLHRDLKPANILVNAEGQPKIIDFGVARLSDRDAGRVSAQTVAGQIIGTMSCMSPEQILADPDEVDTRSDVYALGVVLHELLAGQPPYDVSGLSVPEAAEVITQRSPPRLSTFDRRLAGDLEIIAAKALAKDRDQRYVSASALAGDVRRYLDALPITARRPSLVYQVTRFTQRNRALVTASLVVLVALVAATSISINAAIQAQASEQRASDSEQVALAAHAEAQRERQDALQARDLARAAEDQAKADRALAERSQADAILARDDAREAQLATEAAHALTQRSLDQLRQTSEFYHQQVLAPADRSLLDGTELTLRGALDRASDEIAGVEDDEVRATLLAGFGDVYLSLADYSTASALLDRALALRRQLHDPAATGPNAALCQVVYLLARAEGSQGHPGRAEELFAEALADARALNGEQSKKVATILQSWAQLDRGQGDMLQALSKMEEARLILASHYAEDDPVFMRAQLLYFGMLRFVETNADVVGKLQEMIGVELQREPPDRAFIAELSSMVGSFLLKSSNFEEALGVLELTEQIRRDVLEPQHPLLAVTLTSKGGCLLNMGQVPGAIVCFEEALAIFTERNGAAHPSALQAADNLAVALLDAADFDRAEELLRTVIAGRAALADGDGLMALSARAKLGTVLTRSGQLAEAEQVLLDLWEVLQGDPDFFHQQTDLVVPSRLVELYRAWDRPTEAKSWAQSSVN